MRSAKKNLCWKNGCATISIYMGSGISKLPPSNFLIYSARSAALFQVKKCINFFDREGNTLVLRPDMTPSIARCMAKYYREETMPVRFCYIGDTFVNNTSYQGKLKQVTQLGAELLNDSTVEADAEMVAMTVDCLLASGLKRFQVEIGQADFFRGLMEEALIDEQEAEELRLLIEDKNMFGVEEIISGKKLPDGLKEVILKLPELFGSVSHLDYVSGKITNARALGAIGRLKALYALLCEYGFEEYITFDLGMLSKFDYYTGIIFRAYTFGTGDAVASGGRYDGLVKQFGKDAPAIGMAVIVNQLLCALSRQDLLEEPKPKNTLLVYPKEQGKKAVALAKAMRAEGRRVELLLMDCGADQNDYVLYAGRMHLKTVLFISGTGEITEVNP